MRELRIIFQKEDRPITKKLLGHTFVVSPQGLPPQITEAFPQAFKKAKEDPDFIGRSSRMRGCFLPPWTIIPSHRLSIMGKYRLGSLLPIALDIRLASAAHQIIFLEIFKVFEEARK